MAISGKWPAGLFLCLVNSRNISNCKEAMEYGKAMDTVAAGGKTSLVTGGFGSGVALEPLARAEGTGNAR